MEKVIVTLQHADADDAWCTALRTEVVEGLLALDLPGIAVNVRDAPVRDSMMTLTTLNPALGGVVIAIGWGFVMPSWVGAALAALGVGIAVLAFALEARSAPRESRSPERAPVGDTVVR